MTELHASPVPDSRPAERGFEELYEVQYAPMVRVAHLLVDTLEQAEEIVEELVPAIRRPDGLNTPLFPGDRILVPADAC